MIRLSRSRNAVLRLLLVLGASLGSARASAQPIAAGIARDANVGTPLQCLHVALIDSAGKSVVHAVTDSAGEFMLEAPRPGAYRVEFIIQGWERLGGPVDTLAEADFRQREYPLAFTSMLVRDPALGPVPAVYREANEARDRAEADSVHAFEIDGTWQNRRALPSGGVRYPETRRRSGAAGTVLAQFIVDSTGRARESSWRLISTSHADFENAVRKALPEARWRPARNGGKPVCELVLDYTQFSMESGVPKIQFRTR